MIHYRCEKCGNECAAWEDSWTEPTEAWGVVEHTRFYELKSLCCDAEVSDYDSFDLDSNRNTV